MAQWTNEEWLSRLAAESGEREEAVAELVRMLEAGLRRALAGRPEAVSMTEDFAHDAAMAVLGRLDTFRGESLFRTWALSIAIRVAFDELRKKRWKDRSLSEWVESGAGRGEGEREIGRGEAIDVLRRAVEERLTAKQREAIELELKGVPQVELAVRLGISRNALYKLTHDARRALKSVLSEAGVDGETVGWAFGRTV